MLAIYKIQSNKGKQKIVAHRSIQSIGDNLVMLLLKLTTFNLFLILVLIPY